MKARIERHCALTILILISSQMAWCVEDHTGFWLDTSTFNYLDQDKNWGYSVEGQLRTLDKDDYYELFYLQGKLGYHHQNNLSFSAGYQWTSSDPMLGTSSLNTIFEELYWWPISKQHFVMRTRSRFEQINMLHEEEWGNLFRQRASFYFPNIISDTVTPLIYDEIAIGLNSPPWDENIDTIQQNLLFIGADINITKTWFISTGYLQRYIFKNPTNDLENILYLGINYNPAMIPDYNYIK
jgi:hypothetical protein